MKKIIEFQLRAMREPGTPGRTCTPTAGYFRDKTKISKKNFGMDYYLLLNYCTRQCIVFSPTWAKTLTKFNSKMQDFKTGFGLIL